LFLQQSRWIELESMVVEMEREPEAAIECAVLRGRAHLARQEFTAARPLLEDAIRRAPGALTPYVILSHLLLQSNDENAAEPLLRQIVAMAPDHAESWRNLAILLRRKGRMREAIAAAQSGRLHCPNDADLLLLHGLLLREGGDSINAERTLLHLLEMDTGNGAAGKRRPTGRHNLAGIYRDMGRMREAISQWRVLLVEVPDHADARRCLAECEDIFVQ
jgi:tetratricopeptide (TPR) repeat protein